MGAIDKHIVEANVKLQDENNVLKDDKKILNLRVEEKDKVINDLLSRIATLEYEVERLNNIINDIDTYIHLWKLDDIGEKTMLILNDILLIKNGMKNEVVRLGSDKE